MGFNRIEAKVAAKTSMRLTRPSVMLVTLVYGLLTVVLSTVLVSLIYNPIIDIYVHIVDRRYEFGATLDYIFRTHLAGVIVFAVLCLLLTLYNSVMHFGYTSYALRLARSEQPSFINLFDGFAKLGRVLWMNILIWIFTALWAVVVMAPSVLLVILAAVLDWDTNMYTTVYTLLDLAGSVALMAITFRYRLAPYFLVDDPACTAREAVRRSKEAMRGWKMELFTLDISFYGWIYLAIFSCGILFVWLEPYRCATEANFYDCVTATPPATGGYAGPGYDYGDPSGPQAF